MKRVINVIAFMAVCVALNAQHFIGVSVDGKFAFQPDDIEQTAPGIGGGAQVGFVYEYQYGNFVLNTGVAAAYTATSQLLDSVHTAFLVNDTRGIPVSFNGIIENRRDIAQQFHAKIPFLFGAEWGKFYIMGGAIFDMSFIAWTSSKCELYTEGDYLGRYYDVIRYMPNHGYHDFESHKNKGTLRVNPDLRFSAEIGASFIKSKLGNERKLKLGLFIEYGVIDAYNSDRDKDLYEFGVKNHAMTLDLNHIYSSNAATGVVRNVEFGIRGQILFQVGGRSFNSSCNCFRLWL